MKNSTPQVSARYLTIDSLRGIAALSVAVFHLSIPTLLETKAQPLLWVGEAFKYGYLGVAIFFVISGFVIASTINTADVSFGFLGRYIVKRAIRLDPPYWVSIFLDLALIWFGIHYMGVKQELPSLQKVLAHLVYLQDLLGYGGISAIYWTLCMEVQFYIFFSLIFAVANFDFGEVWKRYSNFFVIFLFSTTTLWSLLISATFVKNPIEGIFLPTWHLFVAGALCYWVAIKQSVDTKWFYLMLASIAALGVVQLLQGRQAALTAVVVFLTAGFIYVAARSQRLSIWLCWRPLLYLGAISYSLYLFHGIVGERFMSLMRFWLLPKIGVVTLSTGSAVLLFLGGVIVSIVFSHAVNVAVERPAMRLSKKINLYAQGRR